MGLESIPPGFVALLLGDLEYLPVLQINLIYNF